MLRLTETVEKERWLRGNISDPEYKDLQKFIDCLNTVGDPPYDDDMTPEENQKMLDEYYKKEYTKWIKEGNGAFGIWKLEDGSFVYLNLPEN